MRCSSEADKTVAERQSVAGNKEREREKWREEEKEESGKKVSEEPPQTSLLDYTTRSGQQAHRQSAMGVN